jgi:hypothetical protein
LKGQTETGGNSAMERRVMVSWALKLSNQLHESLLNRSYLQARDFSLQIHSILEIMISLPSTSNSPSTTMKNFFKICLYSFKNITDCLTQLQLDPTPPLPSSIGKQDACPLSSTSLRAINFSDIVGSDDAKQVLYENVILPLSLPQASRIQLFQGIRSSGGNILLFGPPGTGWCILLHESGNESLLTILPCPHILTH